MPPEANFNELLSKQIDSVERPKLFPVGNYSALVTGHESGKSPQKGTDFVQFGIKLTGPQEDVDPEAFEEAGGMEKLQDRRDIPLTFYITDDALFRLKEFLQNTLELSCDGRAFDTVIPEATNCPLLVKIKHVPSRRKEGEFWMDIDDTAVAN